jgi:hypothetical protein
MMPDKRDLRGWLWDISFLGGALASVDDDHLDDADLALDSLSLVWFVLHLERVTARPLLEQTRAADPFRSVNSIHAFLRKNATERPTQQA